MKRPAAAAERWSEQASTTAVATAVAASARMLPQMYRTLLKAQHPAKTVAPGSTMSSEQAPVATQDGIFWWASPVAVYAAPVKTTLPTVVMD